MRSLMIFGLIIMLLRAGVAQASNTSQLRLGSQTALGIRLDERTFRVCNGMTIRIPKGAKIEPTTRKCPRADNLFVPYHGKVKANLLRGKPSPTPSPRKAFRGSASP